MRGKHEPDDRDLRPDDPLAPGDRGDPMGDDEPDDEEDPEILVARRPNPLPGREEDEEELAEADILDELDLEDTHRIDRSVRNDA